MRRSRTVASGSTSHHYADQEIERAGHLPPKGHQFRPGYRAAICRDDECHDAGNTAHRHGAKAELPGWQAAGKTGTSQEYRDGWFVGYTEPHGNRRVARQRRFVGNKTRLRRQFPVDIWSRFMKEAHKGLPPQYLPSGTWSDPARSTPPPIPPAEVAPSPMASAPAAASPAGFRTNDQSGPRSASMHPEEHSNRQSGERRSRRPAASTTCFRRRPSGRGSQRRFLSRIEPAATHVRWLDQWTLTG